MRERSGNIKFPHKAPAWLSIHVSLLVTYIVGEDVLEGLEHPRWDQNLFLSNCLPDSTGSEAQKAPRSGCIYPYCKFTPSLPALLLLSLKEWSWMFHCFHFSLSAQILTAGSPTATWAMCSPRHTPPQTTATAAWLATSLPWS